MTLNFTVFLSQGSHQVRWLGEMLHFWFIIYGYKPEHIQEAKNYPSKKQRAHTCYFHEAAWLLIISLRTSGVATQQLSSSLFPFRMLLLVLSLFCLLLFLCSLPQTSLFLVLFSSTDHPSLAPSCHQLSLSLLTPSPLAASALPHPQLQLLSRHDLKCIVPGQPHVAILFIQPSVQKILSY